MAISLSPADKQSLIDLERLIPDAQAEIDRAERAGLDVTKLKAQFEKAKLLRVSLLQEYG